MEGAIFMIQEVLDGKDLEARVWAWEWGRGREVVGIMVVVERRSLGREYPDGWMDVEYRL